AHPDGSLTGSLAASDLVSPSAALLASTSGATSSAGLSAFAVSVVGDMAASAPALSRVRNAVTSPPVGTMATTDHPSAALAVSFVARAEGSYEEALIDSNSCMDRERSGRDDDCCYVRGEVGETLRNCSSAG